MKNWSFANAGAHRFRSKKIAYYGYIGGIFFDLKMWVPAKEARKNNFYIYAVLSSSLALLQIFGN